MRVGYLTYGLDRKPTGIGRYAVELLHAMAALPNAPTFVLLTTEAKDSHGLWKEFEHHPLPGCRLLPALMTLGNLFLPLAIQHFKLDILHDPNGIAPFLGPALGTKRIVTIYDAFAYVFPETHNLLDNWRYRWMLPLSAKRAAAVTTISECSRQDLQRFLGLKEIQLIPAALNPCFRPIPESPERSAILTRYGISQPYILYVGGINARKNIARLFEAFANLRKSHSNLFLVIAGKRQWQTAEIDATFQRLELEQAVHFTGYVADEDLPALYSAAKMFVFPSLYEGFGLPPLEAMACGTPVITANSSSLPEVVEDAALLIDPYDVAALTKAMQRVLTEPELAAELRAKGLIQAQKFTWARTAQETVHLYETLRANAPA